VQRVYVRTDDFQLAHRLLKALEFHHVPVVMLSTDEPLPDASAWWFASPEEVKRLGGRGVPVSSETVDEQVLVWTMTRSHPASPKQLVFGLDPGPRPGCACFADGTVLGKTVEEDLLSLFGFMARMVEAMSPEAVLVRVGHGSPMHRDRLINEAIGRGYWVEEVNEYRTSTGASRHAHGLSAVKIGRLAGKPVHEQRDHEASLGELRNLQRISRQRSKGALTISIEAARRVSQGQLTLEEALFEAGYEAS
jgi:hypothetical protein